MYLLDTNVISELRKIKTGRVDPRFEAWSEGVQPETCYLSVATILELEVGILLMERRDWVQGAILRSWMRDRVLSIFSERILAIDMAVSLRCAALHVPYPRPEADAMIAATALVHGLTVATRNVADFEPMGVRVLNPWHVL
jgi:hypothetical protein